MGAGWTSSRAAQQRRDLLARSAAAGDVEDDQAPGEEHPPPARRGSGRRHCWLVVDDDVMPGVVAGWEKDETGSWRARVAYLVDETTATVATGWFPAACLHPYPSAPPLPPSPRVPTD